MHRQVKARTELFHRLDRIEPLRRLFGQAFQIRHHQIGISLMVRAADAAAQLVQLRQAEFVGARHHDGVGARHIDAGFDDGRAQQQIVFAADEFAHHPLQFALGHLPMGDDDARFGQQLDQLLAPVLDRVDLVVQEIDLPAALQLAQHRFTDHAVALAADKGLDRQPALRRGRNHAQVTQPFQRHAQGARDRRGSQGQHIDFGAHCLHRLLVAHAEAVLFVDHQQPQAHELDVGAEQLVGADDDVDRAIRQAGHRSLDFLG